MTALTTIERYGEPEEWDRMTLAEKLECIAYLLRNSVLDEETAIRQLRLISGDADGGDGS